MQRAGVNVNLFKPHSCRASAVSKALSAFMPISEIIARAGWKNEKTFQKYLISLFKETLKGLRWHF
ncbi:hypothetical protein HOLleu_18830 [Holothuria leucospilota]|uniref:Tyr recombinase domain-containing protein n=1 Tax=Holothuria leucospilota TaxID=206669 RepID=A0A9Q1C2D9_HOLLE|nr:hypothetical protein HOLleu_18830 [Holothuria leucospilota]